MNPRGADLLQNDYARVAKSRRMHGFGPFGLSADPGTMVKPIPTDKKEADR
jgi:hypothetical protein